MANVTVSYKLFPGYASDLRTKGKEMNGYFSTVFSDVSKMGKDWYGIRYNVLADDFNKLSPTINDMLKLIMTDTPYTLEKIARNYASFDGGKKKEPTKTPIKAMAKIKKTSEDSMGIDDGKVKKTKTAVEKNFTEAKKMMDKLETVIKKMKWTGPAANSFRSNFAKNKTKIETEIKKINTQFGKLMEQTIKDAKSTESANMGKK